MAFGAIDHRVVTVSVTVALLVVLSLLNAALFGAASGASRVRGFPREFWGELFLPKSLIPLSELAC